MNRYSFIGNLGKDAEVRSTQTGDMVIGFSVAITEKWKNAAGEPQEKTHWVNCSKWVKAGQSTAVAQYLTKGTKVLVEGVPTARAWASQDGAANASLEVNVREIVLLGGQQQQVSNGGTLGSMYPDGIRAKASAINQPAQAKAQDFSGNWNAPQDDDLPF